jgi:hypothetical protein
VKRERRWHLLLALAVLRGRIYAVEWTSDVEHGGDLVRVTLSRREVDRWGR